MKSIRRLLFANLMLLFCHPMQAEDIFRMGPGLKTRWASAENPQGIKGAGGMTQEGRKGRPCFSLKSGATQVLAEANGTSGMIRRIWLTINKRTPQTLRKLRIEFYWDGASRPAISAPLGDFFGMGLGEMTAFQSALFSSRRAAVSTA